MADTENALTEYAGYDALLADIKARVRTARVRAALAINRELVLLYWNIGRDILTRQQEEGWGAKVIERLARDLKNEFPEMSGLSPRNMKYMRSFAEAYSDEPFVQQVAAQIPWFHNCTLMDKVKDAKQREWYIRATIENGWSRAVLEHQIESRAFERQGKALSNFGRTLPAPQSDLAQQLLKDPCNFDFLSLTEPFHERELEQGLITHLRDFLVELGVGFSFVGSQYHLEVGGEDFYIDLLFYHLKLRCFIVIELKTGNFKPEYAGKMQFYLTAVDRMLRHESDSRSIGLILCKTKNEFIVEYTLHDTARPIGVSEYELTAALPDNLRGSLPTVEEIEAELQKLPDSENE